MGEFTMKKVDILFVIPPFHMRSGGGSFFPIGTGYIISTLEKMGYSWAIFNCTEFIQTYYEEDLTKLEKILSERLRMFSPLVVGIGPCITTQLKALKKISLVCNEIFENIPIFAGGPLATIDGQEWIFSEILGINYLVKGDGEYAIADIIRTLKGGEDICHSSKVSYGKKSFVNVVENLDALEFPYRDFSNKGTYSIRRKSKGRRQAAMIASRGCPYSCAYCVSGNMKYNQVPFRRRSNSNIVEEMRILKNEYEIGDIIFYDDCFFSNKKNLNSDINAFCNLLIDANLDLQWQIEIRPDFFVLLSAAEFLLLEKAGCRQMNIGIEKVTQRGLQFLGKTGNRVGLKESIALARKTGIKISATFILGGEGECEEDIIQLVEYAKKIELDFVHFNPLFIYPGTPLYNKVFSDKKDWVDVILNDTLPWGEIVYENDNLNKNQLLRLVDYAYREFYKKTSLENTKMIEDRFNIKKAEGDYDNANL